MPRTRPRLDRDRIVAAAVEVVEADGIEALSMRRVARRLGTAPMSLYRHVTGKDELVALVAGELTSRLPAADPSGPWPEVLTELFTGVRRLLDAHPGLAAHLTDEAALHEGALRATEGALTALERAGLEPRDAARAFTALWTFTVGSALVEESLFAGRGQDEEDGRHAQLARLPGVASAEDFPAVTAAAPHWLAADPAELFEAGLALLLDGVRARAG